MGDDVALVWLSRDLRLADNPALDKAIKEKYAVVPVFIWAPEEETPSPGAASSWWLHQSLQHLQASLARRGSRLIIRRGPTEQTLLTVASETGAGWVFWNRCYEPASIARDLLVERALGERGITTQPCAPNLLFEPGTILNSSGKPFQVFSAFWRACMDMPSPAEPVLAPGRIPSPAKWPPSLGVSELRLLPAIDWAAGLRQTWRPGESSASEQMKTFLNGPIEAYSVNRDLPGRIGTSRLSPHLHFGEISARQIWHDVRRTRRPLAASEPFLRQLAWREFSHHLLFHYPYTLQVALRPEFRSFPWRMDAGALKAWTQGKTGYPLVDAGMRELWHTGWMHNRVRMLTASFLVKHLLIAWQEGAAWFWDTLVDADLANNTMGWQWSAGCGADAVPYFRIFNPVIQGETFDPHGEYVRRWVPELARVPDQWLHKPWKAPSSVLLEAGVRLGETYPAPIVQQQFARERALAALRNIQPRRKP